MSSIFRVTDKGGDRKEVCVQIPVKGVSLEEETDRASTFACVKLGEMFPSCGLHPILFGPPLIVNERGTLCVLLRGICEISSD